MRHEPKTSDRVVITGIGLLASVGDDRESVWHGVRNGDNAMRRLSGLTGIPDGMLIGALPWILSWRPPTNSKSWHSAIACRTRPSPMCRSSRARSSQAASACAGNAHMGDIAGRRGAISLRTFDPPTTIHWRNQWLPNTACSNVGNRHNLMGPRLSHSDGLRQRPDCRVDGGAIDSRQPM